GEELRAPDANGIGLLDDAKGGFGLDMWEGTNPLLVQRLMPALPVAVPSPTARSLQRRLLLSITAPPVPPEGERQTPIPLLKLRADKLMSMGETEALLQLLEIVPSRAMTP